VQPWSGLGTDLVRTWYGLGTDLVRRRGKAISVGNAERAGSERKTKSVGSVESVGKFDGERVSGV